MYGTKRRLYMSKSFTISRAHYLGWSSLVLRARPNFSPANNRQRYGGRDPRAIRNELSERGSDRCFRKRSHDRPSRGPYLQGEERGLFTIGVAGCDRRRLLSGLLSPSGETIALRSKRFKQGWRGTSGLRKGDEWRRLDSSLGPI